MGGQPEAVHVVAAVDCGQCLGPPSAQTVAHRRRESVANQDRQQGVRVGDSGKCVQQRRRLVQVHQHAVAEHDIEAATQKFRSALAAAVDELDPRPYRFGLAGEVRAEPVQQLVGGIEAGDEVTRAGQAKRLRALTAADIEPATPLHELIAFTLPPRWSPFLS